MRLADDAELGEFLGGIARLAESATLPADVAARLTGLPALLAGIDETEGSLVLAGDIQANGYLQLMHASTDTLVRGAEAAAQAAGQMDNRAAAGLAILVSCVGRKLAMGARVDEEVEAVADVLGRNATLTGFYSNGEISPMIPGGDCKLNNQTMTITCLAED